ncbi:hypothetical protein GCM10018783_43110 [Streptomyces griseosporeus]|nr:hypothetical protein GCM10018783_43110 [Streptomyces griseosporeus]
METGGVGDRPLAVHERILRRQRGDEAVHVPVRQHERQQQHVVLKPDLPGPLAGRGRGRDGDPQLLSDLREPDALCPVRDLLRPRTAARAATASREREGGQS